MKAAAQNAEKLNKDVVSVIIPIYKAEPYLKKCLDSIAAQTYKNLEIILIDDGSPDNCGRICDEYAANDPRVKVIHKQNGGMSDARNTGLDNATGEYLTFIDSDDYVSENFVDTLLNALRDNDADMSVCSFVYAAEDGRVLNSFVKNGTTEKMDRKQALFELLKSTRVSNSPWAKLYRTSLFEGIRYPYGEVFEDLHTTYKLFLKCDSVAFVGSPMYFYLYRADSISKQRFKPETLNLVRFAQQMIKDIVAIYPEHKKIAECRMFDQYSEVIRLADKDKDKLIIDEMKNNIRSVRKTALLYPKSGKRRKVRALLSFFGKY